MVVVLTHGDADGICSAALLLARYPDARIVISRPLSIVRDLEAHLSEDLIFVCDIAINPNRMLQLQRLSRKLGKRLTYLDHHALQLPGHRNPRGKSSSEITWNRVGRDVPDEMLLIAALGAIADSALTKAVSHWAAVSSPRRPSVARTLWNSCRHSDGTTHSSSIS